MVEFAIGDAVGPVDAGGIVGTDVVAVASDLHYLKRS